MGRSARIAWLVMFVIVAATIQVNGSEFRFPSDAGGKIVVAANADPVERLAADTIVHYFEKITGTAPAVVEEGDGVGPVEGNVFVGATTRAGKILGDLSDLPGDGYAIRTADGGLFLAGPMPIGTLNAAVGLLQDHLGVVWGMAGSLWTHVPRRERIVLENLDEREAPAFAYRVISGVTNPRGPGEPPISFYQAMRLSDSSWRPRFGFGHNLLRVLPEKEYAESHPEYYAMREGKRVLGRDAQPCFANPDVFRITVDTVRKAFDENPKREAFSLCANDNNIFCECDVCRALDDPPRTWRGHGIYSDSYFDFIRRVAEKVGRTHPDRCIGAYAYWGTVLPPRKIERLPENVHVALTQDVAQHFDPDYRVDDMDVLDGWLAKASTVSVYVYWNLGWITPRYFPHIAGDYLREISEKGVWGIYCEAYPNWVFQGPMMYTTFRQMWDPSLDTDELLDLYMRSMFGEQAATMARYYDLVEKYWTHPRKGKWFQGLGMMNDEFAMADPELLERAVGLLYEARFSTQDPVVAKRLDWMIEHARLPQLLLRNHREITRWVDPRTAPDPMADPRARFEGMLMVQRDREAVRVAANAYARDPMYIRTYYGSPRFWFKVQPAFEFTQYALLSGVMRSAHGIVSAEEAREEFESARGWLEDLRFLPDDRRWLESVYGKRRWIRDPAIRDAADMAAGFQCIPRRAPVLDGDPGEWPADEFRPLDFVPPWAPGEKIPAAAALSWDDDALYTAVKVRDPKHVQTRMDADIWREDSVQVGIDPLRNAFENWGPGRYDEDDLEIGIALVDGEPVVWCYTTPTPERLSDVRAIIVRRDGNTFYEAAIPWRRLLPDGGVPEGFLGINVAVNGSDGGERRAAAWTYGILDIKDPRAFVNSRLVR